MRQINFQNALTVSLAIFFALSAPIDSALADDQQDAVSLNEIAVKKIRAGKYKSAVKDLSEALKLVPNYETGRRNRLIAYFKMKDFTSAISDFEFLQNTQAFDETSVYLSQMGDAYIRQGLTRQKSGDLDGAIESFDKANMCAPRTSEYLHYRGLAHKQAGNFEQAEEDFALEKQSVSVKSRVQK